MLEKVKGLFGLKSDSPIIDGMKSVIEGDGEFKARTMMTEKAPVEPEARPSDDQVMLHSVFHDLSKPPTERGR
ncbi:MAG: hypothetical protein WDN30_14170 [Pararobbsia sp.]